MYQKIFLKRRHHNLFLSILIQHDCTKHQHHQTSNLVLGILKKYVNVYLWCDTSSDKKFILLYKRLKNKYSILPILRRLPVAIAVSTFKM